LYVLGAYNFIYSETPVDTSGLPKVPFTIEAFLNGKRQDLLLNLAAASAGTEAPRFGPVFRDSIAITELAATAIQITTGRTSTAVRHPPPPPNQLSSVRRRLCSEDRRTRAGCPCHMKHHTSQIFTAWASDGDHVLVLGDEFLGHEAFETSLDDRAHDGRVVELLGVVDSLRPGTPPV